MRILHRERNEARKVNHHDAREGIFGLAYNLSRQSTRLITGLVTSLETDGAANIQFGFIFFKKNIASGLRQCLDQKSHRWVSMESDV